MDVEHGGDVEHRGVNSRLYIRGEDELDHFLSFGKGLRPDLERFDLEMRKKDDEYDLEMQPEMPVAITRTEGLAILKRFIHLIERRRDTDVLGNYQSKHTQLWEKCFEIRREVQWVLQSSGEQIDSNGDLGLVLNCLRSQLDQVKVLDKDVSKRKWKCYALRWLLYFICFGSAVV